MSDSRLEKFIYAICSMEVSDLPAPLSRIETLWNCLITGETPDFEPQSRNELYLMAILELYDVENLPTPLSRGGIIIREIYKGFNERVFGLSFIFKTSKERLFMSILFLLLECLKELFFIVVLGGFVAIASAGVLIYILSKLLDLDHLKRLFELEDKVNIILEKQTELDEDYVYLDNGEKVLYDEDTQE